MSIYEFKEQDAFDFVRAIGAKAKKIGDELSFSHCPYCKGGRHRDTNTFSLNLRTGVFQCMRSSCGAHGNMLTLSRDFNFSLGNDVDEYFYSRKKFRSLKRTAEKKESKPAAVEYMKSRGISEAITEKYGITVRNDNDKILVFPFNDDKGLLQFVKYRKTDFNPKTDQNKEWCEKDCKPILFGMDQCDPENKTLVMTEGQIDSLSVAEAGIENAVSVPTGAKGFTWVPYCWDWLQSFQTLIIFGDYEHEHISLLAEMKGRFNGTLKHVREEDYLGCKDANEILQKHGKEAVRKAVENAKPVIIQHIKLMETVEKKDMSKVEKFSTGIEPLDRILGGFYFGQLVEITGARGLGKSTLASQFMTQALKYGYNIFIYSGELPDWSIRDWFDRQIAGPVYINSKVESNGFATYSVDANAQALMEDWYKQRIYLYDNSVMDYDEKEETSVMKLIQQTITQYACRVILIDNLMTAISDDFRSDIYRQQTEFVKELAKIAKRCDCLIFLIVHPRKSTFQSDDNDKIAGSSNITNLANVIMAYERDDSSSDKNTMDRKLKVWKSREIGRVSRDGIKLYFDEASKRISTDRRSFDWKLGWEPEDEFMTYSDDFVEVPF